MAVTLLVELGLDDGPTVALGSVTWTDVTADVRNWSVNRGRTSELSGYSAGSATVVFGNSSRKYDQSNTAGVFYGKIKPRRRLRITLTAGAVSAAVFTGYITDWQLDWPEAGLDATATVSAADAFDLLATRDQPGSAYAAAVLADSPDHYWPMQEVGAGGSPALLGGVDLVANPTGLHGSMSQGSSTMPIGEPDGGVTGSAGASIPTLTTVPAAIEAWVTIGTDTDFGQFRAAIDATNRIGMTVTDAGVVLFYSNSTSNLTVSTGSLSTSIFGSIPPGAHHIVASVSGSTMTVYVDAVEFGSASLVAGTYSFAFGTFSPGVNVVSTETESVPVSHLAFYGSALSAADALAHHEAGSTAFGHPYGEQTGTRIGRVLDSIGWPSADREITDPGTTVVGQWLPARASVLAGCRECETVEQGAFFINAAGKPTFRSRNQLLTLARCITSQATFGDDAAETPVKNPLQVDAANLDFVRNAVTVTYEGGSIAVKDATSITSFGELEESVGASLLDSTSGWVARQLANYRLRLRKDPVARVPAVTAQVLDDVETHLATLIPLELCDRVTVNRRPSGGTGSFSQACHIQGIRWGWSAQQSYTWQAYLAPAVPSYSSADYLLIGDATYGKVGSTHTAVY